MNIREAKEEIKRTILAYTARTEAGTYRIPTARQRPVLLMGPPGIGKTAIMEQVAKECDLGLVAYTMTHHTRQSAIGLPMIENRQFGGKDYAVTDYTMSEILSAVYEQMERTGKKEGILFLDEINCVSETLMPALLQFLQYKTFGTHKLPEGWIVAAAGNPVRYNQSVRELDTATLDRVKWMEIEPDLQVWKSYAKNQGVHPAILAFLEWKPESFYAVQADPKGRSFVTARGWEDLSRMIETLEELELTVDEKLPGQYLQQEETAQEFWIFYQLYRKCQKTPYEEVGKLPFDERLCILQVMLQKIYRLADAWKRACECSESLCFFLQGCKHQMQMELSKENPDCGRKIEMQQWLTICQTQLEKRKQGIQVKKECGILSAAEEEKELLLQKQLQKQFARWRMEDSLERGDALCWKSEDWENEIPAVADAVGEVQQNQQLLYQLLGEYTAFFDREFTGKQERYLFCLGLLEHECTRAFLRKQMPELVRSLEEAVDLKAARARIRSEIQLSSTKA